MSNLAEQLEPTITYQPTLAVKEILGKESARGYMEDANERLVPLKNVTKQEIDLDEMVKKHVLKAAIVSEELAELRREMAGDIQAYIDRMFKEHDVTVGGKKGNVTLYCFDRRLKLERVIQGIETINEKILMAKSMMFDIIETWTKGANRNLQSIVKSYWKTDKHGKYNITDLKKLKRTKLEVPDDDWDKAIKLLDEAIEKTSSATYFRCYYREPGGNYRQVPLDIAQIPLFEGDE
jgi:hypothetical protein